MTLLTQSLCCLCSGILSGMPQKGLTCITCLGQVIKVLSLFQAANEAEVKQLQSRWVQVHILLWHLQLAVHVSQASSSTEPVAEGFLPSRQAWGCPAGKSRSISASSAV